MVTDCKIFELHFAINNTARLLNDYDYGVDVVIINVCA